MLNRTRNYEIIKYELIIVVAHEIWKNMKKRTSFRHANTFKLLGTFHCSTLFFFSLSLSIRFHLYSNHCLINGNFDWISGISTKSVYCLNSFCFPFDGSNRFRCCYFCKFVNTKYSKWKCLIVVWLSKERNGFTVCASKFCLFRKIKNNKKKNSNYLAQFDYLRFRQYYALNIRIIMCASFRKYITPNV